MPTAEETVFLDGNLSRLDLDTEYRSTNNEPVETFYKNCLKSATLYQRAVGYFRSSIFLIVGRSMLEFAKRGGRVQLICSPNLTESDVTSIADGYARREDIVASSIIDEFDQLLADPASESAAKALATLITFGALEIRLAELKSGKGIYHEKIGIFSDDFDHTVSFRGSTNETWSGWHADGNFEAIEVFCDWKDQSDKIRTQKHKAHFELLWSGNDKDVAVSPFPKTAEAYIRKYSAGSIEELVAASPNEEPKKRSPLPHQEKALEAWRDQGCRGILEHATGTGKTFTAIVAIRDHVHKGKPALVLVPSRLLLRQWSEEIGQEIPDAAIMLAGDGNNRWKQHSRLKSMTLPDPELGPRVTLAMMPTAATDAFLSAVNSCNDLLLVADEVHQLGSPVNSRALAIQAGSRLGLSATPKRYGDPDGTKKLMEYFGGVVPPRISLQDALTAGRLVPYQYFPHAISLTADEADLWLDFTNRIVKEIAKCRVDAEGNKELSEKAKMLLIQRSRIAKKAASKTDLAARIVSNQYEQGQSWLVYCEDSEQLSEVVEALEGSGINTIEYHSGMLGDRDQTMKWFEEFGGVLVSIKCLDEGVDIPKVSHALILASSQNPRQFIQRRGRVLRKHPGKHLAEIHDAIVTPVSPESEPEQLGLLQGELLRAIEFASGALNKSAGAELRSIAMSMELELDDLSGRGGIEDDD